MPKYKITYKRQRICEDIIATVIEASTKKEAEEIAKTASKEDLFKKYGSVEVSKNKITETDWKPTVAKGD